MANLELKFLGRLSLRQNGFPIPDPKTQKGLALLCYLAVTRQSASRGALAGLLWPDRAEADAHMNLRKVLFRLKPLSDHLVITRANLAFDPAVPHSLDVEQFETNAAILTDIGRLQRAVELFGGEFLDGFYLDDAPAFDEWVLGQRARLRTLALRALQVLVEHFTGLAAYDTAIGYARRLLAIEAWHEETHLALMRLLALAGQRSAALVQYELCRDVLARELGVAPAAATVDLYEQIKLGAMDGLEAGASTLSPGSAAGPPRHTLPVQTTPFVGRVAELAALAGRLADPNVRLLTILGLGGMGKTRLALAAAGAEAAGDGPKHRLANGAIFVALARLEAPDQLVPAIAEAADLRFMAGREPKAQLLDFFRHKAMLLVLDNFEHLRAQAGLVDEILRASVRVKVLVTSRERLNLQSEYLFPIAGMALPGPAGAEQSADGTALASYGAIQLFCERARRVQPDFELTPANEVDVLEICRLVHGMPLGIVLASAWLETLTPSQIAAEIRADLDFLRTEMQDLPERQRSLRAAFNHAWRLLPQPEREAFQRLSVFRGGFTRLAAQKVAGATLSDLHGLVNKSLLSVSAGGRYDVHELLRQYGTEILAATPKVEADVQDRHCANFCSFLADHSDHWHMARQLETLASVSSEADNVQRAWQWALDHDDYARLAPAMDSWAWYHIWRGRHAEAANVFREVAERIEGLSGESESLAPEVLRAWARAMTWQGAFSFKNLEALEILQASLSLLDRPVLAKQDVRRDKAFVLKTIAERYYSLDRRTGRQYWEKSLALFRACSDEYGIANGLTSLGYLDWATGGYARALERVQAGLVMHQARGDLQEQADSMNALAWIYQHLGRLDDTLRLRREDVALRQQLGNRSALEGSLANLAHHLYWHGRFEDVRQTAESALAICLELGDRGSEGYIRLAICMAHLCMGRYEQATAEGTLALAQIREPGINGTEASVLWALGCLALVRGDLREARSAFAESKRLYAEVQDNFMGLALTGLAYSACCEGQYDEARGNVLAALRNALQLEDHIHLVSALPCAALFLALTGGTERAVEVWELARRQPFVGSSRWHADVVGAPVESAEAALLAGERQAARECGRELHLWDTARALVNELQVGRSLEVVGDEAGRPMTARE